MGLKNGRPSPKTRSRMPWYPSGTTRISSGFGFVFPNLALRTSVSPGPTYTRHKPHFQTPS